MEKFLEKRQPERPRNIWEDSIKRSPRYVGSEDGRYVGSVPNGGLGIIGGETSGSAMILFVVVLLNCET